MWAHNGVTDVRPHAYRVSYRVFPLMLPVLASWARRLHDLDDIGEPDEIWRKVGAGVMGFSGNVGIRGNIRY